jgi:hypothetical protein
MSLNSGEITGADLSPNANILGTQIADNTIQLRNLTDSTFRIVTTGTASVSLSSFSGSAGNYTVSHSTTDVAHGLSVAPVVIAYITPNGSPPYRLMPYTSMNTTPLWATYSVFVDMTNVTFRIDAMIFGAVSSGDLSGTVRYYILQESSSS